MNNFSLDIDYLFITLFLVFIYYIAGSNIAKGKSYWQSSILCIISMVFIMGVRYNRGNDYMHYIAVYEYDLEDNQILFTWFNNLLKSFDTHPIEIFAYYAFPFAVFSLFLLKRYKLYAKYLFPLFVVGWLQYEESMIRQILGFSFGFVYLFCLFKIDFNNIKKKANVIALVESLIFLLCSYSIHSANVITLAFITVIYLFLKKPVYYKISIPLYLIAALYLSTKSDTSFLNPILSFLSSQDDKFSQYADKADVWFGKEGYSERYTANFLVKFLNVTSNCAIMYFGYKLLAGLKKIDKSLIALYNVYVLGTILYDSFVNYEAINRITRYFYAFWIFPFALILFYRKSFYKESSLQLAYIISFGVFIHFFRYLFLKGDQTLFLWDI